MPAFTPSPPPDSGGLFSSLRRLLGTALELGQVRLELLVVELEQQKLRALDALAWAVAALLLAGTGLLMALGFILLLLEPAYRLPAMGVLALGLLAGAAWCLGRARARLLPPEGAFAGTRAELARDRAALSSSSIPEGRHGAHH